MRYLILGAGAVGGSIGGRLFQHGRDVVLVARGPHLDALRCDGLTLRSFDESAELLVPAVGDPVEISFRPDDVVILATKTQQTAAALDALAAAAPVTTPIVCAQNGVENERLALRRFANVYGLCVMLPSTHLEPGVVEMSLRGPYGILDLGRYPTGAGDDETAISVAADLEASGFLANVEPAIMRRKYAKLLMNLGNAVAAACGPDANAGQLSDMARAEARACFAAAGIDVATDEEDRARRAPVFNAGNRAPAGAGPDRGRRGGSSWQSLARATGSIETDYLNGEIVLLGRLHGVPTPVNELLQTVADRLARDRTPPGSVTVDELLAQLPS